MYLFRHFLLFLGLSGLPACQSGLDDPPLVVTVEPEFTLDAYEQRDSSNGLATRGLWVESRQKYDCAGYHILSEVRKIGQQIEVELLDVQRPADCTGLPSVASQFVPLGQLAAGSYPFRLTLGKTLVNEGTITVENDRFSLTILQPQGIEIQNFTAQHLPDALLWGYVAVPDEAANTAAHNFITDLKAITSEAILPPGFYSYFTVTGTGEVFFHSSIAPTVPVFLFVRKLTVSPTELKNLLQDYRAVGSQQEPLTVRCFSSFGEL